MSLQSERLLAHMQRLRLSHLPCCYESLAETAAAKNLHTWTFWNSCWMPRARPSTRATFD